MGYEAKILCDSLSIDSRNNALSRLTTLQVTFPRIILAEFNTHRMFSRNSASSRAIPVAKMIERVQSDPFIPEAFAANQKGMQAGEQLHADVNELACDRWYEATGDACRYATYLAGLDVHKQWANRLIEPFAWHTVIVTATEWDNFFALRCNKMASPEINKIACMMRDLVYNGCPQLLQEGDWHLPLIDPNDLYGVNGHAKHYVRDGALGAFAPHVSAARCARVSYLTHEGKKDIAADMELYRRLKSSGHWSPMEHPARPATIDDASNLFRNMGVTVEDIGRVNPSRLFYGNFRGWVQLRKEMPGEAVFQDDGT